MKFIYEEILKQKGCSLRIFCLLCPSSPAVRSVGSIALRKAEDIDFKYHFDFFSVNFNEELVALYGGTLQKQTKFVHECIKAILKLYKVTGQRGTMQ